MPESGTTPVSRRIVGDFAIEPDGSFRVTLPANTPLQLQTVDETGLALATCGWIWVKPREPRGCIGCHEDPELTPENRLVSALQKPAVDLTLPAEQRRSVDYRRDIQPVLERRCVRCHDGGSGALDLRDGRFAAQREYVHAGEARTSPLIWRLYGRNTSRPWDADCQVPLRPGVCPPATADPLTADEKAALVEWIDLGAVVNIVRAGQEHP